MQIWHIEQMTSKEFAEKLSKAGRHVVMTKSDLVGAYKCLPVCIGQRWLQGFVIGRKLFIELRMMFGDMAACMLFDHFHRTQAEFHVIPKVPLPKRWRGYAVDDLPTVVPVEAREEQVKFVAEYRKQLDELGIAAAPADPLC